MNLLLTEKSEVDLESIAAYIKQSNPKRSATFVKELFLACEGVARRPLAFPLAPRLAAVGIRRRVFGNYLIFHRASADVVLILRVLHTALNHERLLADL